MRAVADQWAPKGAACLAGATGVSRDSRATWERIVRWIRIRCATTACLLVCLPGGVGLASAGEVHMSDPSPTAVLSGAGPWQRFIVKYRAGSAPRETRDVLAGRLASTLGRAGLDGDVTVRWERRLGVGADLVVADRPLDRERAQRLLAAFVSDPDVEYAEPDAMMQHMPAAPGVSGPVRGD